eukprot:m51a1_g12063 putative c2 domain containing protein (512) ;mRNA; r:3690-5705
MLAIFYKFALDNHAIHGSDGAAMKAAGHDMKGLQAFTYGALMAGCFPHIRVPLMCMVDWLGYRVLACTILPIGRATLVLGSPDAGATLRDCPINTAPKCIAEQVASWLRLKRHELLSPSCNAVVTTSLPFDFEVHQSRAGDIYCVDFARLFPPREKRGRLTKLFRPEFLRIYPKRLCSDAFTTIIRDQDECAAEVVEAEHFLASAHVPQVVLLLDRLWGENAALPGRFLVFLLHHSGINMHYLGRVLQHSKCPSLQRLVLVEMISRLLKNAARARLRSKQDRSELSVLEQVFAEFEALDGGLWGELKRQAALCYPPFVLSRRKLPSGVVASAVQRARLALGLRAADGQGQQGQQGQGGQGGQGEQQMQMQMQPQIGQHFLLSFQQAFQLKLRADAAEDAGARRRLLGECADKYYECIESSTQNRFALHNMSRVLRCVAGVAESEEERGVALTMARELGSLSSLCYDCDLYRWKDLSDSRPAASADSAQAVFRYADTRPSIFQDVTMLRSFD